MAYYDENVFIGGNVPVALRECFIELARQGDRSFSAELRRAMRAHVAAAHNDDGPGLANPGRVPKSAARGRHEQA